MITINVSVPLYSTESKMSVFRAIKNLFDFDDDADVEIFQKQEIIKLEEPGSDYTVSYKEISIVKNDRSFMNKLHGLLREQYIVETARSVLFNSLKQHRDKIIFGFHKQAALKGKLHFSGSNESPLGAIIVSIEGDDLEDFINWLTPPTRNGSVIEPGYQEVDL
ncbi:MAG: RNA-binding domain-containing protein [Promethearchaeota archaeon]